MPNINKNCFSPKNEPHTPKFCLPVVLKHFWGNSQRTSLFSPKSGYLRKEYKILRFVFLNMFEKGQILRIINTFWSTQLRGKTLTKTCFSPQSEPYRAKLCFFCCFEEFLGKFTENFSFWSKSDYLRKEHWNIQRVVFLTFLKV